MKKLKYFLLVSLFISWFAYSQKNADDIEGTWYNGEKSSKIKIEKCGNKYCGKIVWLKKDKEDDGGPRIDKNNPDTKKRKNLMIGLQILNSFKYYKNDKVWDDGTIYDPKNCKTYSCTIKKVGKTLEVRGYVGISMFGRTDVWTFAE